MQVFLIHGMGRTPRSMTALSRALRRAGHSPVLFGYAVRRQKLQHIAAAFEARIRATQPAVGSAYGIIGHSLGNLVTRLASPSLPAGFERFIMLAPPNNSPALARAGRKRALFRVATGDAGERMASPDFYATLPVPDVPTRIIAGDHRGRAPWLPYRGGPNDGVVSVEETQLDGIEHHTVTAAHSFIMNNAAARQLMLEFLR